MKKLMSLIAVGGLAVTMGACVTPAERATGGALIGGATGAAVGAAVGGDTRGALVGGALGAGAGAVIGAGTAPTTAGACPAGYFLARDGFCYPR